MTTAPGDPLSYVPQIMAAYEKVISNTKGSLIYATEAGELLNSAKKAIAKKGEWLRWLGHNLLAIPQTTASLYMRLAENKEVIDKQRLLTLSMKWFEHTQQPSLLLCQRQL